MNPLSMQLVRRRTDGAATLYAHEPFDGAPEIRARAESGIGFTAVRLEGFSSDDPTLPEGMDAQPFVREAIQRGVLCVPGGL